MHNYLYSNFNLNEVFLRQKCYLYNLINNLNRTQLSHEKKLQQIKEQSSEQKKQFNDPSRINMSQQLQKIRKKNQDFIKKELIQCCLIFYEQSSFSQTEKQEEINRSNQKLLQKLLDIQMKKSTRFSTSSEREANMYTGQQDTILIKGFEGETIEENKELDETNLSNPNQNENEIENHLAYQNQQQIIRQHKFYMKTKQKNEEIHKQNIKIAQRIIGQSPVAANNQKLYEDYKRQQEIKDRISRYETDGTQVKIKRIQYHFDVSKKQAEGVSKITLVRSSASPTTQRQTLSPKLQPLEIQLQGKSFNAQKLELNSLSPTINQNSNSIQSPTNNSIPPMFAQVKYHQFKVPGYSRKSPANVRSIGEKENDCKESNRPQSNIRIRTQKKILTHQKLKKSREEKRVVDSEKDLHNKQESSNQTMKSIKSKEHIQLNSSQKINPLSTRILQKSPQKQDLNTEKQKQTAESSTSIHNSSNDIVNQKQIDNHNNHQQIEKKNSIDQKNNDIKCQQDNQQNGIQEEKVEQTEQRVQMINLYEKKKKFENDQKNFESSIISSPKNKNDSKLSERSSELFKKQEVILYQKKQDSYEIKNETVENNSRNIQEQINTKQKENKSEKVEKEDYYDSELAFSESNIQNIQSNKIIPQNNIDKHQNIFKFEVDQTKQQTNISKNNKNQNQKNDFDCSLDDESVSLNESLFSNNQTQTFGKQLIGQNKASSKNEIQESQFSNNSKNKFNINQQYQEEDQVYDEDEFEDKQSFEEKPSQEEKQSYEGLQSQDVKYSQQVKQSYEQDEFEQSQSQENQSSQLNEDQSNEYSYYQEYDQSIDQ